MVVVVEAEMKSSTVLTSDKDIFTYIGKNVTTARKACGWKQIDLAAKTGLSRSTIGKIESFNVTDVSISTLSALANAFEIPAYVLMLGSQDWNAFVNLTSLQDLIRERKPIINAESINRLEQMAQSESQTEKIAVAHEIQMIVAGILSETTVDSEAGKSVDPDLESTIGVSHTVSAAIGTDMLPKLPILNAMIAEIISASLQKFISNK